MNNLKEISLNEIENIRIGHAQDEINGTGCSVLICEKSGPCGIDVRGGGPASRETQLLNPVASNNGVHAIVLSGGSAYGLEASSGVMQYLEEKGIGLPVGDNIVPIVCQSCIFDLAAGNGKVRPTKQMGYDACMNSELNEVKEGNVGAGMGATVGKILGNDFTMKAGLGTYAVQIGELKVGAMVVVNAIGDVYELDTNKEIAGLLNPAKDGLLSTEEMLLNLMMTNANQATNTTIGIIITNARLDKTAMNKVAALSSNGLARTIRPVNTSMDGDSIYAISCGEVTSASDIVGTIGAYVLGKAVNRAVLNTESALGFKAAKDLS